MKLLNIRKLLNKVNFEVTQFENQRMNFYLAISLAAIQSPTVAIILSFQLLFKIIHFSLCVKIGRLFFVKLSNTAELDLQLT